MKARSAELSSISGEPILHIDSGIVAVTLHNGDKFGGDNEELSRRLIAAAQGKQISQPGQ